jgi:hypothetical protein
MEAKLGWETLLESQDTFPGPTLPTTSKQGVGSGLIVWVGSAKRKAP